MPSSLSSKGCLLFAEQLAPSLDLDPVTLGETLNSAAAGYLLDLKRESFAKDPQVGASFDRIVKLAEKLKHEFDNIPPQLEIAMRAELGKVALDWDSGREWVEYVASLERRLLGYTISHQRTAVPQLIKTLADFWTSEKGTRPKVHWNDNVSDRRGNDGATFVQKAANWIIESAGGAALTLRQIEYALE